MGHYIILGYKVLNNKILFKLLKCIEWTHHYLIYVEINMEIRWLMRSMLEN